MRTALIFFICLLCLPAWAEKSNKKLKEIKDNYSTISYTVDRKSKLKDGEFLQIRNKNHDTLIIGQYENDRKIGLWKYKSSGNKNYILYNYDSRSAEYLDPAINKVDSFLTIEQSNGLYFLNKVDAPPVYIGFKGEVKTVIDQNVKVPVEEMSRGIKGVVAASFVIDRTGKIGQIKIERSLKKSFDKIVVNAIESLDSEWIPAKVNNVPTDAKMNVLVRVHNSIKYPKIKEEPYEIVHDIAYFGIKSTYSTSREISVPVSSPMGGARNTF